MGKTISGTRNSKKFNDFGGSDGSYKGGVLNVGSIRDIKHAPTRLEVQGAISRYESALGLGTTNVKIATLNGALGVAMPATGEVYLNRKYFVDGSIAETTRKAESTGFLVSTTRPVGHVVVHELAHQTWSTFAAGRGARETTGKQQKATIEASKKISNLYKEWRKEVSTKKRKPLGKYSTTNANEFFAEYMTAGTIGTKGARRDKYAKALVSITKQYGLKRGIATKY